MSRRSYYCFYPAMLLMALACDGAEQDVPADVMDRETFIATYVDLREAVIATPDFRVTDEQRAAILARHGVDSESLIRFADAHGSDLDYMNEIWTEVETRIEGREAPETSVR
jgi:hypothetical protein